MLRVCVARDLSMCAIRKMSWAISKSRIRNFQISDPNPNLALITIISTQAKLCSAFCKVCRLTNCVQHVQTMHTLTACDECTIKLCSTIELCIYCKTTESLSVSENWTMRTCCFDVVQWFHVNLELHTDNYFHFSAKYFCSPRWRESSKLGRCVCITGAFAVVVVVAAAAAVAVTHRRVCLWRVKSRRPGDERPRHAVRRRCNASRVSNWRRVITDEAATTVYCSPWRHSHSWHRLADRQASSADLYATLIRYALRSDVQPNRIDR